MQEVEGGNSGRSPLRIAAATVAGVLVIFLVTCSVSLYAHDGSGSPLTDSLRPKYPLNFLVVGDWGREGQFNQTLVAKQVRDALRYLSTRNLSISF